MLMGQCRDTLIFYPRRRGAGRVFCPNPACHHRYRNVPSLSYHFAASPECAANAADCEWGGGLREFDAHHFPSPTTDDEREIPFFHEASASNRQFLLHCYRPERDESLRFVCNWQLCHR